MNILHIAAHMGDGAGKAIGGLATLGNAENTHRILLLDTPLKRNHVERCEAVGIDILARESAEAAIAEADVVVLSWWGSRVMDEFLTLFHDIPCRLILWAHKNGYHDPPLADGFVRSFDWRLATSPWTLEMPLWKKRGSLVYGFGDFNPIRLPHKSDFSLRGEHFTLGYVGTASYKKLPRDWLDCCKAIMELVPSVHFVFAGETNDEFAADIARGGLSERVSLLGHVADVPQLLTTFDAFCYPLKATTYATTENAVLEAQAAALPLVMSREPLGRYFAEHGADGFLAATPREWAASVATLYADGQLRARVGVAARKRVVDMTDATANLRRFHSACEDVMQYPKRLHKFDGGANV